MVQSSIHRGCWVLIVLALSMFAVQAASTEESRAQCTSEALCGAHRAAEARLVADVKAKFESGSPEEMRVLLDRLLASEQEHSNVPSPSLAQFLAQNVEGEERRILEASAEELTQAPLAEDASGALRFRVAFAALEHCKHPDMERAVIAVLNRATPLIDPPEPGAVLPKKVPKLEPGKNGKPPEGLDEVEKFMKAADEWTAAYAKLLFAHDTACEAIRVLAKRPSAAGQSAAFGHFKRVAEKKPGMLDGLTIHVLEFNSEAAFLLVIDSLRSFRGGLEAELDTVGGKVVEGRPWGARIHDALVANVEPRGLPVPVVRRGDQLVAVWRKWFSENHEKITPGSADPSKQ